MKKFLKASAVAAAATLIFACACTSSELTPFGPSEPFSGFVNYYKEYSAMGTMGVLNLSEWDEDGNTFGKSITFRNDVADMLSAADNSLSTNIETSYIYAFNHAPAGATVELDETAYDVLSCALEIHNLTDGFYNPAVYYNVQEHGFPLKKDDIPTTLPDQTRVDAFCDLASHFGELELKQEGGKYYAVKPSYTVNVDGVEYSLAIDLGGIGKGWCADKVWEMMDEYGYEYGIFNFGSSSLAVKRYAFGGDRGVDYYNLSPRDPRLPKDVIKQFCDVHVKDNLLSTSGDYEQYYEIDGTRYCHIINPFTGSPVQTGVASVTIIGGNATEDDALTTALSCMGKEKAVEFINEHLADKFVLMLVFEGEVGKIITNRPEEVIIVNTDYAIANTVENGRIVL